MRGVLAAALRRLAHRLEPLQATEVQIVCDDVEEIIRDIKVRNRRKGIKSAGI